MNTKDIDKTLLESEEKQLKYLTRIDRLKNAIEILESEDITIPEEVYGSLAFYQTSYDRECNAYKSLLKVIENEEEGTV